MTWGEFIGGVLGAIILIWLGNIFGMYKGLIGICILMAFIMGPFIPFIEALEQRNMEKSNGKNPGAEYLGADRIITLRDGRKIIEGERRHSL